MKRILGQVIVAAALGLGGYQQVSMAQEYTQQEIETIKSQAAAGDAKAQVNLGLMYNAGEGVRKNKSTAKEWFGKACDNGNQAGCDSYRLLNEAGY